MSKVKPVDVKAWNRYKQYLFFKEFDSPFFNVCSDLKVTNLRKYCKLKNTSFFVSILYESLVAANSIKEFKYRLVDDGVVEYETIYAGSTVLTDNDTFNFCYIDYFESYKQFNVNALECIRLSKSQPQAFEPKDDELGLIHYSSMPWISFTSITHARNFKTNDSVPKIVFGKFYKKKKKWYLPISIEVHHALMDGLHVGRYLSLLQKQLSNNY